MDMPLAVCDGSTVAPEDCVVGDIVGRDYVGETIYMLPSIAHKWFYLSNQRPDEALLLKIFDSSTQVRARCEYLIKSLPSRVMTISKAAPIHHLLSPMHVTECIQEKASKYERWCFHTSSNVS